MASIPVKTEWYVSVEIDKLHDCCVITEITQAASAPTFPLRYMYVIATDEIGAFNEARKILERLGFTCGR